MGGGGRGEQGHRRRARLQEIRAEPAPASDPAGQKRDQHEEHAGDGEIDERPLDGASALAQGPAREGEGRGAGNHAQRGSDRVCPEADSRDPVRVVLQVEREERNETREHDDPPSMLGDQPVDPGQARLARTQAPQGPPKSGRGRGKAGGGPAGAANPPERGPGAGPKPPPPSPGKGSPGTKKTTARM